jgi:hypothetical protein
MTNALVLRHVSSELSHELQQVCWRKFKIWISTRYSLQRGFVLLGKWGHVGLFEEDFENLPDAAYRENKLAVWCFLE